MEVAVIVLPAVSFCFVQPRECPLSLQGFRGVGMYYVASLPRDGHRAGFLRDEVMTHFTVTLRFCTFSGKNWIRKRLLSNPHPRDTKSWTRASIFRNYQL